MANASLLKGGVMVVLLLAALAVFDALNNYATNQITGAYSVGESKGVSGLSVDLSNYPSLFVNALIVTGDSATSAEVAAAGVIADSLDDAGITSSMKKASEVADTFAQNVISVGTGCVNYVTQQIQKKFGQLLDSRYKCYNAVLSGEGVGAITLYDFGNGKVGLVVEGYTEADLRRAANVLKSHKDWQAAGYLIGKGILVEATSQGGTKLSGYSWAAATDQTATDNLAATPARCSEGEKAVIRQGETRRYLGPEGREYDIYAESVGSMTAKFTVTLLQEDGTLVTSEVLARELGEFTAMRIGGETVVLKTFTTVVDRQPYGMQFCLRKATDVTAKAASVAIKAGWNIIGANTMQALVSTTCGRNQIDDTIWVYYPQANDYGRYKLSSDLERIESAGDEESDNLRNTYQGTLSATGAFWLYNKGEACTMTSGLAPLTGGFTIADGWNMLAVQTNWQGEKLSGLLGSCNFRAGYFFDPTAGWAVMSRDTVFEAERVGKGFWMYATSCSFKALAKNPIETFK